MSQVTTTTTVIETKTNVEHVEIKDEQPIGAEEKPLYVNEPMNEGAVMQTTELITQEANQSSSKSTSTRRIAVDFNSIVSPQDQAFEKYAVMEGSLKFIPLSSVYSALVDLNMNPSRTKLDMYMKKKNIPSIGMSNMQFKDVCKFFQFTIADIDKLIDIFLILDTDKDLEMNKEELRNLLSMAPKKDAITGPSFENLYADMEPQGTGVVTIRAFLLAYFPDPIAVDEALRRRGLLKETLPEPEPEPELVKEPEPVRDFDAEFAQLVNEEETNRQRLDDEYDSQTDRLQNDMINKYKQLHLKAKPVQVKQKSSCPCCNCC